MMVLPMIASKLVYQAERPVPSNIVGSTPDAMWWGIATLTIGGYGDIIPLTPIGRFIASVVMVLGFRMFAIPIVIIASEFSSEIHSR
jgi:voltage-gated potassium channel